MYQARMRFPKGVDILFVLVTLLLIPLFYALEVYVVFPALFQPEEWMGLVHQVVALFFLHNVVGNLACGMAGPGLVVVPQSVYTAGWRFCDPCARHAPPRSWHCSTCDICVLKRDHHCNYFGCCIGYYNHRYFYMFVLHVFASTLYSLCFNIVFIIHFMNWNIVGWMGMLRFFFPLVSVAAEMNKESLFAFMFMINVIAMCFTGFLLVWHFRVIVRGKITPESKKPNQISYDNGWRNNLKDVLGVNWYLTWISPFVPSKMPGDGITWKTSHLIKVE